jgi:hypothetical protein
MLLCALNELPGKATEETRLHFPSSLLANAWCLLSFEYLTPAKRFRTSFAMFPSPEGTGGMKRLAALLALVAVFCLPLHFHSLAAPAQVVKECACVHGMRTLLGPISAAPMIAPVNEVHPFPSTAESPYRHFAPCIASIRAPPTLSVL